MDKDLKKDIEKLGQASRLVEEEQMHGENIAGIVETNEDIEDSNELITKLIKKLKVWKGVLITGIVVFIIILLYMLFTGVVKKAPEPIEPSHKTDYKVDEEPTEVTEVIEPTEQSFTYYYKNVDPSIDMSGVDSCTISDIVAQGYILSYDNYTIYQDVVITPSGEELYPVSPSNYPNDSVYLLSSLKEVYESTDRNYEELSSPIDTSVETYASQSLPIAVVLNDNKDSLDTNRDFTYHAYNKKTLAGYEPHETYLETDLVITAYENVDDETIKSEVENLMKGYKNSVNFSLGTTEFYDNVVNMFGSKMKINMVNVSVSGVAEKSNDLEAPSNPEVTKTYTFKIYDDSEDIVSLAARNKWY